MSADQSLFPMQFRELYHGTRASRVGSIRETGLTPPEHSVNPARWYMLTSRKDEARAFARADDGAMITYRVPEHLVDEYLHPGLRNGEWSDLYALRKPLPSSMVHQVDVTAEPRPERQPVQDVQHSMPGVEDALRHTEIGS